MEAFKIYRGTPGSLPRSKDMRRYIAAESAAMASSKNFRNLSQHCLRFYDSSTHVYTINTNQHCKHLHAPLLMLRINDLVLSRNESSRRGLIDLQSEGDERYLRYCGENMSEAWYDGIGALTSSYQNSNQQARTCQGKANFCRAFRAYLATL